MRFSRVLVASLLGLLGCSVDVDAHAKLVSPVPWNAQPSKQQVCGVTANAARPASYVVSQVRATDPLIVQWTIVVADGRGPLTARLDTTAKNTPTMADFKVNLPTVAGTQNNPQRVSNIPYQIRFQIPAGTVCTGPGGTCTLRVSSSSNWVACATIRIMGTAPPPAATIAPTQPPPSATIPPPPPADTSMPIPTTPAPIYPTPVGSGGRGGAEQNVVTTVSGQTSASRLQYMILPNKPQVTGRPQGVIMFLHGSGASNYANGITMFNKVAAMYDFIQVSVLAPNGQGWNEGGANAQITAANQLNTLIQVDLLMKYNIDVKKIFLTGQSSGGGFLSQFFIPMYARSIQGGAFFQCGAAAPAIQFQPSASTIANVKLHFEITTGDTIWPTSYANAVRAYTAAGMSFSRLETKPGGHCRFDQQQVVLDRIGTMLPQAFRPADALTELVTQDASTGEIEVFSAQASTKTRCVIAEGLTACPKVNGQSVQILTTSDLKMVDIAADDAIKAGLSNDDIMTLPPSSACQQAYRDMICASHFIPCGASVAITCQASCRAANQVCSFNQTMVDGDLSHASMYDCSQDIYQQVYSDANGLCADAPAPLPAGNPLNGATSYAQPMMMITLFISLIVALFQ